MNKRTFLHKITGTEAAPSMPLAGAQLGSISLNPYAGPWETEHAVHLYSRTVFGATQIDIKNAVAEGLEISVERLLEDIDMPEPPVYYNFNDDPNIPNGSTWVNDPGTPGVNGLVNARRRSLRAWLVGHIKNAGLNIREKMVLFWHEHLPISDIGNPRVEYFYMNLIQEMATGNFKTLIERMTIEPAMLIYLNGNLNTLEAPNENFSRELIELFTIGRGEAVGDGDYTNYTEQDVAELARALTGWNARQTDTGEILGVFIPQRHDTGTKQLSHRFDNIVIENEGENEYKRVIDIIMAKDETARFICRKLHIWFVGAEISEDIEMNVIEPLAAILRDNDYEIKEVLRALLKSEYFHETARRGCMINSPADFMFKIMNTFELDFPAGFQRQYDLWRRIYALMEGLEMTLLELPTVAGWKAYYQTPGFYEYWINSVSLNFRDSFVRTVINGFAIGDSLYKLNLLQFISKLDNPYDPDPMILDIAKIIFPVAISQNQLDYLKEVLIPGLPDFEWTVEYGEHLADPDNQEIKLSVEAKLEALFGSMMRMPEFYLM